MKFNQKKIINLQLLIGARSKNVKDKLLSFIFINTQYDLMFLNFISH